MTLIQCAETKKSNTTQTALLASLLQACTKTSLTETISNSAKGVSSPYRTKFDFSNCSGDAVGQLINLGFTGKNLSLNSGLVGTDSESSLVSLGSFVTGSAKKVNIEVTYTLLASTSSLEVRGLATASSSASHKATGPGFQILPTGIKGLTDSGTVDLSSGSSEASAVNTEKTLCLEIHEENGAHILGWAKSCNSLTTSERGTYTLNKEGISATIGDKVNLVLNNARVKQFTISSFIGTAE